MIAFDIDGVCADIMPALEQHILKRYKYILPICRQHGINIPGVEDDELWDLFNHIAIDHIDDVKPLPGLQFVTECIYHFHDQPLYFCTARTKQAALATIQWLSLHLTVPFDVGFAGSKDKPRHLQKRGYNTFVEDRLRTANELAEQGFTVFLINQTWNADRPTAHGVTRIASLYEIVHYL
jgi:uncharacterized HAD superfamily protein